jgi:hypothetical protein
MAPSVVTSDSCESIRITFSGHSSQSSSAGSANSQSTTEQAVTST